MAELVFKGFKQVPSDYTDFQNGYIYFVRTNESNDQGYIWFNGRKYGVVNNTIDCGEY